MMGRLGRLKGQLSWYPDPTLRPAHPRVQAPAPPLSATSSTPQTTAKSPRPAPGAPPPISTTISATTPPTPRNSTKRSGLVMLIPSLLHLLLLLLLLLCPTATATVPLALLAMAVVILGRASTLPLHMALQKPRLLLTAVSHVKASARPNAVIGPTIPKSHSTESSATCTPRPGPVVTQSSTPLRPKPYRAKYPAHQDQDVLHLPPPSLRHPPPPPPRHRPPHPPRRGSKTGPLSSPGPSPSVTTATKPTLATRTRSCARTVFRPRILL